MTFNELKEQTIKEFKISDNNWDKERIEKQQYLSGEVVNGVARAMYDIFKENGYTSIGVTSEGQQVIIYDRRAYQSYRITVKVMKKKVGESSSWRNKEYYYNLKDIEIDTRFETIEEYLEKIANYVISRENTMVNNFNSFKSLLEEHNMTIKDFKEMNRIFAYLTYNQQQELEKQGGEIIV